MIKVHGIRTCDSVKKALSFFKANNIRYEFQDFKVEKATDEQISSWLKIVDISIIFNSKSTTYRMLKLKDLNLSDEEKKEWLCKENMLIKRPVVEFNHELIVGFSDENYKGVFL